MATAPHEAEQSMHTTDMHVCDDVDPEFQTLLEQGLNGFNDMAVGYGDRKPLAVVVTDAQTQRPIGGAAGRTSLGLLFLDLFYLPATLRGRGLGSEVLHTLEAEGKRRGCVSAVLSLSRRHDHMRLDLAGHRAFAMAAGKHLGARSVAS
jgi:GNAT superfamily N-acetyltransferase